MLGPVIENTGIWKRGLCKNDGPSELEDQKERLRVVLSKFRERSALLTARIATQFPALTIHDVTHLDALWETADLILGEGYPLNPAETFVLGGAILLHDAAHCFEAYEGGKEAVRKTLEWRDAFASERAAKPDSDMVASEESADFTAIRLLHARQAEQLGSKSWRNQINGEDFFLIEDVELRQRYGVIIGQIAASHNWSIRGYSLKVSIAD